MKPAEALVLADLLGDVASGGQHSLRPFVTAEGVLLGDGLQRVGGAADEGRVGQTQAGVHGGAGGGGHVREAADAVVHVRRVVQLAVLGVIAVRRPVRLHTENINVSLCLLLCASECERQCVCACVCVFVCLFHCLTSS